MGIEIIDDYLFNYLGLPRNYLLRMTLSSLPRLAFRPALGSRLPLLPFSDGPLVRAIGHDIKMKIAKGGDMLNSLVRKFEGLGIDYSYPGFYNEPNFMQEEARNPDFLRSYGFYVKFRNYDDDYLESVRQVVPSIAEELFLELRKDGRQRACVDMSASITKILEQHHIWCVVIEGAFNVVYPTQDIEHRYNWYFDDPQSLQRRMDPGHVWVYCPPYEIIDLTIRQQGYTAGQEAYLPNYVLQEGGENFIATLEDLCSPEVRTILRQCKISQKHFFDMKSFNKITPHMRPFLVKHEETIIRYTPFTFSASDAQGIEGINNMTFSARSLWEVYNDKIVPIFNPPEG